MAGDYVAFSVQIQDDATKTLGKIGKATQDVGRVGQRSMGRAADATDDMADAATKATKRVGLLEGAFGDLAAAKGGLEKLSSGITGIAQRIALAGEVIEGIGQITGVVTGAIGAFTERANELKSLAQISQTTTDEFQRLEHQAIQTGSSADDMADVMREMQLRMSEAASLGTGPTVDALNLLGLSLEEIEGLNAPDTFHLLRDAVSEVEDPMKQLFLADELFGGSAERTMGLLRLSADEYASLRDESDALRIATEENIDSIWNFGGLLDKIWKSIQAAGVNALGQFITQLTETVDIAAAVEVALDEVVKALTWLLEASMKAFNFIKDNWPAISGVFKAVGNVVATVVNIVVERIDAIADIVSGVINTVSALISGDWARAWGELQGIVTRAVASVLYMFTELGDGVLGVVQGIVGIFDSDWADGIQRARNTISAWAEGTRADLINAESNVQASVNSMVPEFETLVPAIDSMGNATIAAGVNVETGMARAETAVTNATTAINAGLITVIGNIRSLVASAGAISVANDLWIDVVGNDLKKIGAIVSGPTGLQSIGGVPTTTTTTRTRTGTATSTDDDLAAEQEAEEQRRFAISEAKAESRAEQLATNLQLYGQERDSFVGEYMAAWQADQELFHTDEVAYYRREETDAQMVQNRWKEQIEGQKQLQEVLDLISKNTKSAADSAKAAAEREAESRRKTAIGVLQGTATDDLTSEQLAAYYQALQSGSGTAGVGGGLVRFGQQSGEQTYVGPDGSTVTLPAGTSINEARDALGIPQLARGGIVKRPTLAMIGEAGPEAVVPLSRGGAMQTVNVTINGDVYGVEDLDDRIVEVWNIAAARGAVNA